MLRPRVWLKEFEFLSADARRRLGWFGFAFLLVGFFLKLTWELHEDSDLTSLDKTILLAISKLRIDALNGSVVDITALGSPTLITLFTLIGIVLLWMNQDRRGCLYLAVGSAGGGIATWVFKHLITRSRPTVVTSLVEVSGYSYPSGHSLGATTFYLLAAFLAWRHFRAAVPRIVILAMALTIIGGVCFSRLYLGVHYPSDVASGVLLGAAWVCFLTLLFSGGVRS